MMNGEGLRVVLWLSSCQHHCYKCQNPQTWDTNSGIPFDEKAEKELFRELSKDYISGLTLTGGDPLHENNLDDISRIVNRFRLSFGQSKTIWLYTGYEWFDIWSDSRIVIDDYTNQVYENYQKRQQIISMCDVLVDGRYIESQRDITKKWAGSNNQRVMDVKQSLNQNKIILYCE